MPSAGRGRDSTSSISFDANRIFLCPRSTRASSRRSPEQPVRAAAQRATRHRRTGAAHSTGSTAAPTSTSHQIFPVSRRREGSYQNRLSTRSVPKTRITAFASSRSAPGHPRAMGSQLRIHAADRSRGRCDGEVVTNTIACSSGLAAPRGDPATTSDSRQLKPPTTRRSSGRGAKSR